MLTETWLNGTFYSSEYFDSSFFVYRTDRESTGSIFNRGGGTLIAVHESYSSNVVQLDCDDDIEYSCVKITLNRKLNLFIYVGYIVPRSHDEYDNSLFEKHSRAIKSIKAHPNDIILVMGDFNIPDANWIPDGDVLVPSNITRDCASNFIHDLLGLGCQQINFTRNFMGRTLDLVFSNKFLDFEIDIPRPLTKIDQYHPPVLLSFETQTQICLVDTIERSYNFKYADFVGLANYLVEANLDFLFINKTLQEKINIFYDVLHSGIKRFVPLTIKKTSRGAPWMNKRLRQLKNKRNREWKRYKTTGDISSFERAFTEFETMNKSLYNEYVDKMASSLKGDPSSFWRFLNSKRNANIAPKSLYLGARSTTDPLQQAELFAEFFNANFSSTSSSFPVNSPNINASLTPLSLDEHFVFDNLTNIDVKKGTGPDGIHPLVLKHCSSIIYGPLTTIFNESLALGIFPDTWKRFSVTPIFKKGARSNIENYRCIAKLPTIGKFFEHLVNTQLIKMVENQITPRQFGFMKHRSTTGNLMEFVTYAKMGLSSKAQVDVLYTDFSKAFDRVNHKILLNKLSNFNIPGNLLQWIGSYLSNRRQFVKYRRAESSDFIVASGVPQGSHIGPTLFLLFINDIASIVDDVTLISLFADDIRITRTIKSTNDILSLQRIINRLKQWCDENDLHLNLDKCAILSIHRGWNPISTSYFYGNYEFKRVSEHRDLGVIIDNKLSFTSHIEFIVSKATSALGFLKRFCYDIRDLSTLKAIYYALVQSNLEYCSIVWSPFYAVYSKKIESVLKQFSMFALREYARRSRNFHIPSFKNRLERLNMISLFRRRINSSIIFVYDLMMGNSHCPLVLNIIHRNHNQRNIRRIETFRIIDTCLARSHDASITQICKWANCIDSKLFNFTSRSIFKRELVKTEDTLFSKLLLRN